MYFHFSLVTVSTAGRGSEKTDGICALSVLWVEFWYNPCLPFYFYMYLYVFCQSFVHLSVIPITKNTFIVIPVCVSWAWKCISLLWLVQRKPSLVPASSNRCVVPTDLKKKKNQAYYFHTKEPLLMVLMKSCVSYLLCTDVTCVKTFFAQLFCCVSADHLYCTVWKWTHRITSCDFFTLLHFVLIYLLSCHSFPSSITDLGVLSQSQYILYTHFAITITGFILQ